MNRFRRVGLPWLSCVLAALIAQPAAAWCDLMFKDVAPHAEIVLLAEVLESKGGQHELAVVETLKGFSEVRKLDVDPEDLGAKLKRGDQVILAMTHEYELVNDNQGLGLCTVVNVLRIRDGKLRARDRPSYDNRRKAMSLDQLRDELIRDLREETPGTRLSAR